MGCCAGIALTGLALQYDYYHWLCLCKFHSKQLQLGAIHLIRICSCNCVLLCSSHIADPNHICTNELLCHVQPNSGNFLNFSQGFLGTLMVELNLTSRAMFHNHSYMLQILEPGLLLFSHSTILYESRPQKNPCACPPLCVCLLPTTADFFYICLC